MTPVTEILQPYTTRMIPSAYYKAPILRALVDNDDEMAALEALDGLTNARRQQRRINPEFDSWAAQCVEAAFAYKPVQGLRFNDRTFGAWYAGFADETSLHEVAFHKTRQLENIGVFDEKSHYQALHAGFIGRFHDVRGIEPKPDYLLEDIAVAYPAGQPFAKDLRAQFSRGLIYPSARHEGGTCIVAFQELVVQDPRPGAKWEVSWSGTPVWKASKVED